MYSSHKFEVSILKSIQVMTIYDFSQLNEEIRSESFKIGSTNEFFLRVNRNNLIDDINYLSVWLHLDKSLEPVVKTKFNLWILDDDNQKVNRAETNTCLINQYEGCREFKLGQMVWGHTKFYKIEDLNSGGTKLLPNNTLTIYLEIKIEEIGLVCNNCNEYEKFINNKYFNDLKIIVDHKEFFVDKIILSLRSKVFESMFSSDLKFDNQMIIEDVGSDAFEEFISFIYTGKLAKIESMAEQLLHLSDKYQILDLRSICEQYLNLNLCVKTCLNILLIADKYNCIKLKISAIKFICDNLNSIFNPNDQNWVKILEKQELVKCLFFQMSIHENTNNEQKITSTLKSLIYKTK